MTGKFTANPMNQKQATAPATAQITATTARKADGWAAVLEFPNGGRQLFSSRHGTMESAQREAAHARLMRLACCTPGNCVPDPAPNSLMILEDRATWPDLLAALRLTPLELHAADEHGPCLCSQCEFRQSARQVIAKATQ